MDKKSYYILLKRSADKVGIEIWAYCFMDNHVHLVAVPKTENALAKGIGEAERKYALSINIRNDWKGHLWQARFNSYPMDEKHLYAAVRYVERNPVRAGLVTRAEDYYWSSAKAHVFKKRDELLSDFDLISSIPDWASFLREETNDVDIELIRSHSKTGRPLGDDKFIKDLERITGRCLRKRKPGRKKKIFGVG
jgi:putative transposase